MCLFCWLLSGGVGANTQWVNLKYFVDSEKEMQSLTHTSTSPSSRQNVPGVAATPFSRREPLFHVTLVTEVRRAVGDAESREHLSYLQATGLENENRCPDKSVCSQHGLVLQDCSSASMQSDCSPTSLMLAHPLDLSVSYSHGYRKKDGS